MLVGAVLALPTILPSVIRLPSPVAALAGRIPSRLGSDRSRVVASGQHPLHAADGALLVHP